MMMTKNMSTPVKKRSMNVKVNCSASSSQQPATTSETETDVEESTETTAATATATTTTTDTPPAKSSSDADSAPSSSSASSSKCPMDAPGTAEVLLGTDNASPTSNPPPAREPLVDTINQTGGRAALTFFAVAGALGVGGYATVSSSEQASSFVSRVADGLVTNHAPGFGGFLEDAYLTLLVTSTLYSLWAMFALPRKDNTLLGWVHVLSGAGAFATSLWALALERGLRESPDWTWMWLSAALYTANALSWFPLLKYYRGSEETRNAFFLSYSFVVSFQGIQLIAWSAQPDAPSWMFWAVMPFWFWSIRKIAESADFVVALLPKSVDAALGEGNFAAVALADARARVKGIKFDTPTVTYASLNLAAAIFDNAYMALYTALGPAGFWHTSQMFNDDDFHLRLIKPAIGSLTVSVLTFLTTLAVRKRIPFKVAVWLNVALASVGPWIVLLWHKLLDFDEMWFPQFVFDADYAYTIPAPEIQGAFAALVAR